MSPQKQLPGWLHPVLWAAPGFLIALAAWPTQTGSTGRFWIGVLVGMSLVALGAGLATYLHDRGVRARKTAGVGGRNRR